MPNVNVFYHWLVILVFCEFVLDGMQEDTRIILVQAEYPTSSLQLPTNLALVCSREIQIGERGTGFQVSGVECVCACSCSRSPVVVEGRALCVSCVLFHLPFPTVDSVGNKPSATMVAAGRRDGRARVRMHGQRACVCAPSAWAVRAGVVLS